jgi:hypothetical protein
MAMWGHYGLAGRLRSTRLNMPLDSDQGFGKRDSDEDFGADYGVDFGTDVGKDSGADVGKDFGTDFGKQYRIRILEWRKAETKI